MKVRTLAMSLTLAVLASTLTACHPRPYEDVRVHDRDAVRVVFSERDRVLIRDYYRGAYRGLPPGLAKKGKLPPGHAYRLRRNEGVPRGVTWERLPIEVERRLSPLPAGYARVVIGNDAAILNVQTRVVVDLIDNLHD